LGGGATHLTDHASVNGTYYFTVKDGIHGHELWKSDGTRAGTSLVKDIAKGRSSSIPYDLTAVNDTLYFTAIVLNQRQLWKSDGTATGTTQVKDISTPVDWEHPNGFYRLTNVDGTLYFVYDDGIHGRELWKSDGTSSGTKMVKDIRAFAEKGSSPYQLTNNNGTLFFTAYTKQRGAELWKSDGTSAGTRLVMDILPGKESSRPYNLTVVDDTLYFKANDGSHGNELWKSDGTTAGTVLVKDIVDGSSHPSQLTEFNGILYFIADDGTHGDELWKSDGTTAGTVLVKDMWPGPYSSWPDNLTVLGSRLFFSAAHPGLGYELWSISHNQKQNLLGNPGFESGDTEHWHVANKTIAGVVSNPVHSGNNALALSGDANRFTSVRQTITSDIVGGHRYDIQTWLAVNGNNRGKFLLEVRWYKADGSEYTTARTKFGITRRDTNFKLQKTELVAPPKAVRMVLFLRANKADGVAYFDDLNVTNLTSSSPPLPGNQPPLANIVSISPNPVVVSDNVSFSGDGSDADGSITGYQWRSSVSGLLSSEPNFSTSSLLEGTHKIYFKVMDNQGLWSNEVSQSLVVSATVDQGDNLLNNADFEAGDTSDWTGTRTHAEVVASPVYEGSFALALSGSPTSSKKLSQSIVVTGGQSYRFEGWVSVSGNSTGKFLMLVQWYDAKGAEISIARRSFGITRANTGYENKTVDLKAPSNAAKVSLMLKANKANGVGYFDDISIRKVIN